MSPHDPAHARARAGSDRFQDLHGLLVLRPPDGGRAAPGLACRPQELPTRLGHRHTRAEGRVARGQEGALLPLREELRANARRAGLERIARPSTDPAPRSAVGIVLTPT